MTEISSEVWFLALAYLQLLNLGGLIIIIGILVYNIIKRTERFRPLDNQQKEKDGVGFGRY